MIELRALTVGYGDREVLREIDLDILPGQVLALVGPNGCGKSTLLRTVLGLQPRLGGELRIDGVDAEVLTPRQRARKVAYLAQSRTTPNITARRMVLHGRFPYLSYPRRYSREDREAVEWALAQVDAAALADRPMEELSGGQRQRVYLAMALAQDTPAILMDEPTTYLDIAHQLEVMDIACRMAREGRAVVLVLHDLCLAMRYAHRVAVLDKGRLVTEGSPEQVYAQGALDEVFGVRVGRIETPDSWQYYCT